MRAKRAKPRYFLASRHGLNSAIGYIPAKNSKITRHGWAFSPGFSSSRALLSPAVGPMVGNAAFFQVWPASFSLSLIGYNSRDWQKSLPPSGKSCLSKYKTPAGKISLNSANSYFIGYPGIDFLIQPPLGWWGAASLARAGAGWPASLTLEKLAWQGAGGLSGTAAAPRWSVEVPSPVRSQIKEVPSRIEAFREVPSRAGVLNKKHSFRVQEVAC